MTRSRISAHVAALTHPGAVRELNEDAIAINGCIGTGAMTTPVERLYETDTALVCIVADGMGGHAAGDVASTYAARRASNLLRASTVPGLIERSLVQINEELYARMNEDPETRGMGTTVAGLVLTGEAVCFFNVGDSRVYREQEGLLRQLSVDDSPASVVGSQSLTGPEGASHVVTQALGGAARLTPVHPHVGSEARVAGRRYLVCSDGLSAAVGVEDMERSLEQDGVASVRALWQAAMSAGGEDNISIVLVTLIAQDDEPTRTAVKS